VSLEPVDLLVFGPHPDDIEIGLGGTVARHAASGRRVGLCDLTEGDLGTNGTIEERRAEAEAARAVLGAAWRVNLKWPDRGIGATSTHIRDAAALIRRARPRVVAIPHWADRHPDHVTASEVLTESVFNSGLRKYVTGDEAWRPATVCYYFINNWDRPSFVIDVSAHYDAKRRALDCYVSQFRAGAPGAVPTRLNSPRFSQLIESRDGLFGAIAGVAFAEGLVVKDPVVLPEL
jgi:bacillithiol biosynthesis deacetylase BshB1